MFNFILVKVQGRVPAAAIGSGLYSDSHSGYLCFHGILKGQCVDKNGNTDLYFTRKGSIKRLINNYPPINLIYTDATQYMIDYFTTDVLHRIITPVQMKNCAELKYPLIIESSDFVALCNQYGDELIDDLDREHHYFTDDTDDLDKEHHYLTDDTDDLDRECHCFTDEDSSSDEDKLKFGLTTFTNTNYTRKIFLLFEIERRNIVLENTIAKLDKNLQCVFFFNAIPYFKNSPSLNKSIICLILKLRHKSLELPFKEVEGTHIYLSFNGLITQQAALAIYFELDKRGYKIFDNIYYDEVPLDYHIQAAANAKLFVLFLNECWETEHSKQGNNITLRCSI